MYMALPLLYWQLLVIHVLYATTLLTHWGRVMHICISKLNIIGSDNGLAPERRQTIIWTNGGILLIGPLGTIFNEILSEILIYFYPRKYIWMCRLRNDDYFVCALMC